MAKPDTITADNVRDLFVLDESGNLVWNLSPAKNVKEGSIAGVEHTRDKYRYVSFKRKAYLAHRVIWLYHTGTWPESFIDHVDGNRSNNKFENLREATAAINAQNIHSASKRNKSCGVLGVSLKNKGYEASLRMGKKSLYLGRFPTSDLAHQAYITAKRSLHAGCTI